MVLVGNDKMPSRMKGLADLVAAFGSPKHPVSFHEEPRLPPGSLLVAFPRRRRCQFIPGPGAAVAARPLLIGTLGGDLAALRWDFDPGRDVAECLERCVA